MLLSVLGVEGITLEVDIFLESFVLSLDIGLKSSQSLPLSIDVVLTVIYYFVDLGGIDFHFGFGVFLEALFVSLPVIFSLLVESVSLVQLCLSVFSFDLELS